MNTSIVRIVNRYIKKYSTRNPYEMAEYLKIKVIYAPLGNLSGFYKYMKRHKCIFINSDIQDENYKRFVMAHELAHAIMHTRLNCYFMDSKTLLNTNRIEIEANQFAATLLIPMDLLIENADFTDDQMSKLTGYGKDIINLRKRITQINI